MHVSLNEVENLTHKLLVKHGADDWIASEVARAVKKAEAIGNKICGLFYVESYCTQLESGRVNGTVEPVVSSPKSGVVQVDAKYGFAQPAFKRGLSDVLSAARENGIAQLSICHSHTCTSLGFFTEQIAREGLIAIGLTNASPSLHLQVARPVPSAQTQLLFLCQMVRAALLCNLTSQLRL